MIYNMCQGIQGTSQHASLFQALKFLKLISCQDVSSRLWRLPTSTVVDRKGPVGLGSLHVPLRVAGLGVLCGSRELGF